MSDWLVWPDDRWWVMAIGFVLVRGVMALSDRIGPL